MSADREVTVIRANISDREFYGLIAGVVLALAVLVGLLCVGGF